MRVVAMFRVSTDRQAEQGASLDAQERQFRTTAKAQGWRIVAEFRGSESATQASTERHVLQQVLACIRTQQPDALYVHEQSRLTRGDELEAAILLRELRERKLKVIVGGVVRDLASIDERFMVGIQSLVDRAESERIRERVSRGKREKGLQGKKSTGRPPYGYANPPQGDSSRGILQIVPDKARTVRRMFDLAAGGVSQAKIAAILNEEGLPSPTGGQWGEGTILQILRNPTYIGTHFSGVWKKRPGTKIQKAIWNAPDAIIVPNAHEAIVPKELWDAVNSRKLVRSLAPKLLSGLLTLNGRNAGAAANEEFQGYHVRRANGFPWVDEQEMERAVWNGLTQVLTQPEIIEACIAKAEGGDHRQGLEAKLGDLRAQAAKQRQRLERLTDMRSDGEITKDEFVERATETRTAIERLERAIQSIQAEMAGANPDQIRQIVAAARIALAPAARLSVQEQRKFLSIACMPRPNGESCHAPRTSTATSCPARLSSGK
jgi:site-specific DNA recombinase